MTSQFKYIPCSSVPSAGSFFLWALGLSLWQVFLPCLCGQLWHQTGRMDVTQKLSPSRILFSPAIRKDDNKIHVANKIFKVTQMHFSPILELDEILLAFWKNYLIVFEFIHPAMAAISTPSTGPDESLAKLWESDIRIRERLRYNQGKLLVWPPNKEGKEQVGVACMAALSMNCNILSSMAGWWCPTQKVPKTPSIACIKNQVWICQKCLGLPTSSCMYSFQKLFW